MGNKSFAARRKIFIIAFHDAPAAYLSDANHMGSKPRDAGLYGRTIEPGGLTVLTVSLLDNTKCDY